MTITTDWRTTLLNERQQKELRFAELYIKDFNHGTTGHTLYALVDRLALLLDVAVGLRALPAPPAGGELVLTFGKYRDRSLAEIWATDPGYIDWLAREGRDPEVRAAAAALLPSAASQDSAPPPPSEMPEDLPF